MLGLHCVVPVAFVPEFGWSFCLPNAQCLTRTAHGDTPRNRRVKVSANVDCGRSDRSPAIACPFQSAMPSGVLDRWRRAPHLRHQAVLGPHRLLPQQPVHAGPIPIWLRL